MPETLQVTANVPEKTKDGKVTQVAIGPFTISVQTGKDAAESVRLFGDAAVKTNSDANWVVTLQGNMRAGMKRGETNEALQARMGSSKMGVATAGVKVDVKEAYIATYLSSTPEEQMKMLGELKARAAQKAAR